MENSNLTPQDKAINHSLSIQCYEIWEYDDVIRGRVIDNKPFWEAKGDYDHYFDIRGQKAHFLLLTHDPSILRREAISFAMALYEKKCIQHRIDTSELGYVSRNKR